MLVCFCVSLLCLGRYLENLAHDLVDGKALFRSGPVPSRYLEHFEKLSVSVYFGRWQT